MLKPILAVIGRRRSRRLVVAGECPAPAAAHARRRAALHSGLIGSVLFLLSNLALGGDVQQGGKGTAFIGVFYPTITSVDVDPVRCPRPSHPILLSFTGVAQTTLGSARFTQSHCENRTHTSFQRGEQTITFDSDGAQLFGTYSGQLMATPTTGTDGKLIASGRYQNTGGTGTLANAAGRGISAGTVDTATGAAVITVSGDL